MDHLNEFSEPSSSSVCNCRVGSVLHPESSADNLKGWASRSGRSTASIVKEFEADSEDLRKLIVDLENLRGLTGKAEVAITSAVFYLKKLL